MKKTLECLDDFFEEMKGKINCDFPLENFYDLDDARFVFEGYFPYGDRSAVKLSGRVLGTCLEHKNRSMFLRITTVHGEACLSNSDPQKGRFFMNKDVSPPFGKIRFFKSL